MTRAVVLGGGGPVGIGWECGLAAGLAEAGIDLGGADLIVGTSAGSVVGAGLALKLDLAVTVDSVSQPLPLTVGGGAGLEEMMTVLGGALARGLEPAQLRAELGAMALATPIAAYSASIYKEGGAFPAIMRFIVMPMFLFSGTFYPVSSLPVWAHWAAWISPLWHATELARWVSLGPLHLHSGVGQIGAGMIAVHLIYLSVLTIAGLVITSWRFKVRLEK